MPYIIKKHIATGVTWVAIEEAELFLCCGCPADTVKHLKKAGIIHKSTLGDTQYEYGPNAILLSDTLIQNGQVANLTEFPILQMLYLQGTNLPGHPNYKKWKPLLIGHKEQIDMQLGYVSIGNHGLSSVEEIMDGGIDRENAEKIFATKVYYSGGTITPMQEIVDSCAFDERQIEIRDEVFIQRVAINKFQISYKNERVDVDLNIMENERFSPPYDLPFKNIIPGTFSVTHTGEGNGWDKNRPCMASVIFCKNRIYLIDAGPNILNNLSRLGIGLSEIDGIFLSHIHDDHFAGITELLNVEHKLNFYATKLIRHTAEKKLKALMNSDQDLLHVAFKSNDLEFSKWTDINGLEVMPVYSPHTVETSTFNFRVYHDDQYKTYTHLSDTISIDEFKLIVEKSPDMFSEKEVEFVEKSYLSKVNLKKIDIGGGAIHGHLSDYSNDESDVIVMAHTSKEIYSEKENCINVDFGETHALIENHDNSFFKSKSKIFLKHYFDTLEDEEIELLANGKIKVFKPGELILSKDNKTTIYLIVRGIVNFLNKAEMSQSLDAGNFLGYSKRYFREDLPAQYSSWSYVYCMEYEESYLNRFILKYGLVDNLNSRINMMRTLRNSIIINDLLSNAIINWISKYTEIVNSATYSFEEEQMKKNLFVVLKGSVIIQFENGKKARITQGEHFGGMELMYDYRRNQHFLFEDELEAISIPVDILNNVPKFLWRLLELEEKRFQISIFTY